MSFDRDTRRGLLLLAIVCTGIASLIYWGVGFTPLQSVVLGVVSTLAIWGAIGSYSLAATPQQQFQPFWFSIQPNWTAINKDHPLASDERWTEINARWQEQRDRVLQELYEPVLRLSVLRRAMRFVAISPTLWYASDHHAFFSYFKWYESIDELREPGSPLDFKRAPEVYVIRTMRNRAPFLELGIITEETWKKTESFMPGDESHEPLAYLPEQLFHHFYHGEWDWETGRKVYLEAYEQLAELGWKEECRDFMPISMPTTLKHKHFTITFKGMNA